MFTRMAGKRTATTELNHDNWDQEEHHEEAGKFQRAPPEVIERRVVKRAKRHLQTSEDSSKSAFGAFAGFKTSSASQNSSPFSFLASSNTNTNDVPLKATTNTTKMSTISETPKSTENGTTKKDNLEGQTAPSASKKTPDQESKNMFKKSSEYFAKLKGLNESVAQWIKTHVDANPFCILTPIFKDYEKYLNEIETKHGSEADKQTGVSEQPQSANVSDKKEAANTEKKVETSPFGGVSTKSLFSSTDWKPEKSIFGNTNTNLKSVFKKTQQPVSNPAEGSKSYFSSTDKSPESHKSVFGNVDFKTGTKSMFRNASSEKNPFLSKPSVTSENKSDEQETKSDSKATTVTSTSSFPATFPPVFCFGQTSTTSNTSTGFSFGSAKPFTFGAQVVKPQDPEDTEGKDDEDEEPPKPEFKPVTEEGAIYSQRCKVFIKKDDRFTDRGIGTLFLKPTPNDKTQLLVRAETSLGNLLLNTLLTESIPTKRMNKNTIMLVCLPKPESTPPPVPVLLRVKTDEDADALLEALNKHKK